MKILLSAYACDPSRGGEFNNGWNYASNATIGREIWCLTTIEGREGISQRLADSPNPYLNVIYVEVPDWLLKWKEKSPQVGVYFHYMYWQYKAANKAMELSKEVDFDLVHHGTYASLQLGSFMWKLNRPFLFGPVGGGQRAPESFSSYFYGDWKLERIRDAISFLFLRVLKISSKTLKNSDLTLAVNTDTFQMAQRFGAVDIDYAPCTLLPDDFAPSSYPEKTASGYLRLLWVGRLIARKGIRVVLEAIAKLNNRIPVKLTIIGNGPMEKELVSWIDELNLQDCVDWRGRQPMPVVKRAYMEHDAFIYCALRETLAAQFFESMSSGLPMIIFDLHGARNFVTEEVSVKVPVSEPDETLHRIGEAITWMYENPAQRIEMGKRAFEYAKQFEKSRRIAVINGHYDRLTTDASEARTNQLVEATLH